MQNKSQNRLAKEDKINKLADSFGKATSLTLADFAGMNIVAQQDLKKRLKGVGAKMIVAKNTLIKLALNEAKLPKEILEDSILSGQTAVILAGVDPVSAIQISGKFATENEALKFKAGVLEGAFQDKSSLITISKLPSKDVLAGQTVGTIAGPMYALLSNLEASIQELLGTLAAKVG